MDLENQQPSSCWGNNKINKGFAFTHVKYCVSTSIREMSAHVATGNGGKNWMPNTVQVQVPVSCLHMLLLSGLDVYLHERSFWRRY